MADKTKSPEQLWCPDAGRRSDTAIARLIERVRLAGATGVHDYDSLWTWSVENPEQFWPLLGSFFDVAAAGDWNPVRDRADMSGAGWFPNLSLNYAEQIFAQADPGRAALLVAHEDVAPIPVSWARLRDQVAGLASRLREWGVKPGDRIAAYLPNVPEAVIGLLASAAVGAVWSCCAPDYGVDAVVDRFAQIEPRVLLIIHCYRYGGREVDRSSEAAAIASRLPSVEHVVVVGDGEPSGTWEPWDDVVGSGQDLMFEPVGFDHPLWILYSSGTTGLPKGIVQSHGGIVLEHLKWLGLQNDVRAGDRYFWYSSTAWMIWNVSVSALLVGATVVVYDGSAGWPGKDGLWQLAAATRATYLGTSAGYVTASRRDGLEPGRTHDLSALRCVMSSGSPLPGPAWQWVYDHVKRDVWLDAPSGGTDVCTPYVGGNPLAPVVAGEMQPSTVKVFV